jgi:hypothetical protein
MFDATKILDENKLREYEISMLRLRFLAKDWNWSPTVLTEKRCSTAILSYRKYGKISSFRCLQNRLPIRCTKTYKAKNYDYGNSFDKSMDEFGITAAVVTYERQDGNVLKSLTKKKTQVKDESVKDTLLDLANYAIMTVMHLKQRENMEKKR